MCAAPPVGHRPMGSLWRPVRGLDRVESKSLASRGRLPAGRSLGGRTTSYLPHVAHFDSNAVADGQQAGQHGQGIPGYLRHPRVLELARMNNSRHAPEAKPYSFVGQGILVNTVPTNAAEPNCAKLLGQTDGIHCDMSRGGRRATPAHRRSVLRSGPTSIAHGSRERSWGPACTLRQVARPSRCTSTGSPKCGSAQ